MHTRRASMNRLKQCWLAAVMGLSLFITGGVAAQTVATGNVEGVVTDTSGGVLPGVTVTVRNMDTNVARELVSDSAGRYRAAALQPGRYEVSANLAGFAANPVSNIEVMVGQTAPIDVRMRPGTVQESIT